MRNAKTELLSIISEKKLVVKCAEITHGYQYDDEEKVPKYLLKVGYSPEEYELFLNSLNFNYDDGFGSQELFGIVWLTNGTWLSRGEYDGSEWLEHNELPTIPKSLL